MYVPGWKNLQTPEAWFLSTPSGPRLGSILLAPFLRKSTGKIHSASPGSSWGGCRPQLLIRRSAYGKGTKKTMVIENLLNDFDLFVSILGPEKVIQKNCQLIIGQPFPWYIVGHEKTLHHNFLAGWNNSWQYDVIWVNYEWYFIKYGLNQLSQ